MKAGWITYAIMLRDGIAPAPGSCKTIEQVDDLAGLGRAEKRCVRDGSSQVWQFRLVETRDAI
jgi:hypothetical protein